MSDETPDAPAPLRMPIFLTQRQKELLDAKAKELQISRSELIRRIIDESFERTDRLEKLEEKVERLSRAVGKLQRAPKQG